MQRLKIVETSLDPGECGNGGQLLKAKNGVDVLLLLSGSQSSPLYGISTGCHERVSGGTHHS